MGLSDDIFADYEAVAKHRRRASWSRVVYMYARSVNFRVVMLYRLGHRARRSGHRVLAYWLESRILRTGAEVSFEAEIGGGLYLAHLAGVVIGSRTKIGCNAYLLQGVTLGGSRGKERDGQTQPVVGDNVLIAAGAKILGPVRIGNNVEIGANAVVLDDLPDDSVAVGVPARVIRAGGRRIPLSESPGEQAEVLRDLIRRLETLERNHQEREQ
jgi:serine O-acetyltransferase